MLKPFKTETYGKWILAGEHAVLRGAPAVAFPLLSSSFKFEFQPSDKNSHKNSDKELHVDFKGSKGQDYKLLFHGVFEQALDRVGKNRHDIHGQVTIDSSLPVGTGLGASAALCVAVGRWFVDLGFVESENVYDFSRSLEDLFHGESSGLDIAVSLKGKGIHFERGKEMTDVDINWSPILKLSYCGSKGLTSECVSKVKGLFEKNAVLAKRLDEQMKEATLLAESSLKNESFKDFKAAILLARDCFDRWGLVFGDLKTHIRKLEEAGAIAVKPTGSGGGGFVLSLWDKEPDLPDLIPCSPTINPRYPISRI